MNVPHSPASSGAAGSTNVPKNSSTSTNSDSAPVVAGATGGEATSGGTITIPTLSTPIPQTATTPVASTTPNNPTPTAPLPVAQNPSISTSKSSPSRRTPSSASASARRPTRAGGNTEPLVRLGTPSRFSPLHVEVQMGPSTIAPGTAAADSSRRSTPATNDSTTITTTAGSTTLANGEANTGQDGLPGGVSATIDKPWKHPDELEYICRQDWPQEIMITYLRQNVFSIPPSEKKLFTPLFYASTAAPDATSTSSLAISQPYPPELLPKLTADPRLGRSFTEIACSDGTTTLLPKGYRVPLMFVAKFQWESLRLVLTSSNPEGEWDEFRFDIVHLSRLCSHLLRAARKATDPASNTNTPYISPKADRVGSMDRTWRCGLFDRALTRFYRRWMICREWSVKLFFEEFGEEEYATDVIKHDWPRWVLKGHKGFVLTKEEVDQGISAEQFTAGLELIQDGDAEKDKDGDDSSGASWKWDNDVFSSARVARPLPSLVVPPTNDGEDAVEEIMSISAAPNGATHGTKRKRSVEIKKEMIEATLHAKAPSTAATGVPYTPTTPVVEPSAAMNTSLNDGGVAPTAPAPVDVPMSALSPLVPPPAAVAQTEPFPAALSTPTIPPPLSIVRVNTGLTPPIAHTVPPSTVDLTTKENQVSKENQASKEKTSATTEGGVKESTVLAGTKRGRDEVDDGSDDRAKDGTVTPGTTEKDKDAVNADEQDSRASKKARPDPAAMKDRKDSSTLSSPPADDDGEGEGEDKEKPPPKVASHPPVGKDETLVRCPDPSVERLVNVLRAVQQGGVAELNGDSSEKPDDEEPRKGSGDGDGVVGMDVDVPPTMDIAPVSSSEREKEAVEKRIEEQGRVEKEKETTKAIVDAAPSTPTRPPAINTALPLSTTNNSSTPSATTPKPPRHLSATQQLLAKPAIRRDSSNESSGGKASPPGTPSTIVSFGGTEIPASVSAEAHSITPSSTPAIPHATVSTTIRGYNGKMRPRASGPVLRLIGDGARPRLAGSSPKAGGPETPATTPSAITPSAKKKVNGTSTIVSSNTSLAQVDHEGLSALESMLSTTVGTQLNGAVRKILETLSKVIRDNQRVVLERLPSTGSVVATTESGMKKTILDTETTQVLEALIGVLEGNKRIAGMVEAAHTSSTDSFGELKGLLEDLKGRLEKAEQSFAQSQAASSSQLATSQADFQRCQTEMVTRYEAQNAEVVKVAGAIQGSMKTTSESLVSLKRDVESVSEKVERVVNVVSQGLEGLRDDVKKLGERIKGLEERPVAVQALPPPSTSTSQKSGRARGNRNNDEVEEEDSTLTPQKKGNPVLVRKVMDVMRNMADILEYSDDTQPSSPPMSTALTVVNPSSKGKERTTGTGTSSNNGYGDIALTQTGGSMLFSAILDEMRGIRDELRTNDKRGREELATLRLLHGAEMESIRRGVRESEENARKETQRWIDERLDIMIQNRMGRIAPSSVNTNVGSSSNANAELIELRRRLEQLESKQRQEVESPAASPVDRRRDRSDSIASSSNDTPMKDVDVPTTPIVAPLASSGNGTTGPRVQQHSSRDWEQPPPVPLRHLNGFGSGIRAGYGASASAGPSRKASTSSLQTSADGISTPPLPVKSQRKAMMALARQPPAE